MKNGGAIYFQYKNGMVSIKNCVMSSNTADWVTKILLKKVKKKINSYSKNIFLQDQGGALYLNELNYNFTIYLSVFSGNWANVDFSH